MWEHAGTHTHTHSQEMLTKSLKLDGFTFRKNFFDTTRKKEQDSGVS